ncbi:12053_t:CDS:2, partial [Acaulospora colombiana]
WNKGELDSFLIEITTNIVRFKDKDGTPIIEKIKDVAGQKGTGKWTAISSLDLGVPVTLIGEAVYARALSALKAERIRAGKILKGPQSVKFSGDKRTFVKQLGKAFAFLGDIKNAYTNNPNLENLLFDPFFKEAIDTAQDSWRRVVSEAVLLGIPTPALSTALSFYDGYRHERLPASLLQAMRDYFGAHTFQYLDEYDDEDHPKNTDVHINWTGHGGNVSASSYQA